MRHCIVVELERVDPGDPQVHERELRRRAFLFERRARVLVVPGTPPRAGRAPSGSGRGRRAPAPPRRESPSASSCSTASARSCSAAAGSPFSQRRWPIRESSSASLARIGDVGENALEEHGRLAERDRALGLVGRAETCVDGLARSGRLRAGGAATADRRFRPLASSASAAREWIRWRFGRTVSLSDRLLGERVAPAVAVARVRALVEELLRDGGLERRRARRLSSAPRRLTSKP